MQDTFDKDIQKALDEIEKSNEKAQPRKQYISNTVPPKNTDPVLAATNADTSRATRSMEDQMYKIIEGLHADIDEARQVRETVNRRIRDLQISLEATMAAVEVIKNR